MLTEKFLQELQQVVDYNYLQLNKVDGDQSNANLITLFDEEECVSIFDPFLDTTLRIKVDPLSYGKENLEQMVSEYKSVGEIIENSKNKEVNPDFLNSKQDYPEYPDFLNKTDCDGCSREPKYGVLLEKPRSIIHHNTVLVSHHKKPMYFCIDCLKDEVEYL